MITVALSRVFRSCSCSPFLWKLGCEVQLRFRVVGCVSSLGCGITALWVSSLGDAEEDSVDLIWSPRNPVWGFQAMVWGYRRAISRSHSWETSPWRFFQLEGSTSHTIILLRIFHNFSQFLSPRCESCGVGNRLFVCPGSAKKIWPFVTPSSLTCLPKKWL